MNANLAAIAYIVSGVLFILALRGLSSPETSRRGNLNGMIGMAIAVGVTLATLWSSGSLDGVTVSMIGAGVAVGGGIGAVVARRVAMTQMPQLVALFHSLVGMAACLVAVAAIWIASTRMVLDAHYPSDIVGGLGLGAAVTFGTALVFARLGYLFRVDARGWPRVRKTALILR